MMWTLRARGRRKERINNFDNSTSVVPCSETLVPTTRQEKKFRFLIAIVPVYLVWLTYQTSKLENNSIIQQPPLHKTIPPLSCFPQKERAKIAKSNCPNNDEWLRRFSQEVTTKQTIVVVGCNKGVDAVRLFAQYDTRPSPFRLKDWQDELSKLTQGRVRGACNQVFNTAELAKPTKPINELPDVYCIEPMPANVQLLKRLTKETNLPPQFRIMPYAISGSRWPTQISCPSATPGTENLGLAHTAGRSDNVNVTVHTIDELFQTSKVDMLLIDTEGNDPLALLGAPVVLQTVSYLEFENHGVGEWKTFKLRTIIDYLDNLDFDCWWTLNNGGLVRITRCWHEDYAGNAFKTWSNIGCAKRNDRRWEVMNELWNQQQEANHNE